MIVCGENCQIYDKCKFKTHRTSKYCVFDSGIVVEEKDSDDFLEKLTF